MKKINAIIEQGQDGFFAYIKEIDGCTAGGYTFQETKSNIQDILRIAIQEDKELTARYSKGYNVLFSLSLETLFKQLPEVNIEVLSKQTKIKSSVLKEFAQGTRMATEEEAELINNAILSLAHKLQSIRLTR